MLGLKPDAGRARRRHRIRQPFKRVRRLHHGERRRLLARLHGVAKVRNKHLLLDAND